MPIAQLVVQLAAATFHLVQIEQFAFHGRKFSLSISPGPMALETFTIHTHTPNKIQSRTGKQKTGRKDKKQLNNKYKKVV